MDRDRVDANLTPSNFFDDIDGSQMMINRKTVYFKKSPIIS
jgi:hypothetical protein